MASRSSYSAVEAAIDMCHRGENITVARRLLAEMYGDDPNILSSAVDVYMATGEDKDPSVINLLVEARNDAEYQRRSRKPELQPLVGKSLEDAFAILAHEEPRLRTLTAGLPEGFSEMATSERARAVSALRAEVAFLVGERSQSESPLLRSPVAQAVVVAYLAKRRNNS